MKKYKTLATILFFAMAFIISCKNNNPSNEEMPASDAPDPTESKQPETDRSGQNIGNNTDSTSVDGERPNPSNN